MPELFILFEIASIIVYISFLGFLITGFLRLKNSTVSHQPTVSVVVAARNEERSLQHCMKALLAQTYPKALTEIVVVNDRSSDKTPEMLNYFRNQSENLRIVNIKKTPENVSPKKFALSQGIARASGELIFTTDADCTPPSEWISETVPLFHEKVGLVIGPAPFESRNNFWTKLLALDNLATAFVTAGATGWNAGVTCTGRNLAYRKAVFDEVGGFNKINHSLSGDDDLFLQQVKIHTRWQINYALNPKTAVPSMAVGTFSAFFSQRRRHVSAGKYYSKALQISYLLFNLVNLVLFVFLIMAFFHQNYLILGFVFFSMKLILDLTALFLMTKKLNQRRLLLFFPCWEIFYLLNQILISPTGFIGTVKWK